MLYIYAPRSSAFAERIRGAQVERSGTAIYRYKDDAYEKSHPYPPPALTPIVPNGHYWCNQSVNRLIATPPNLTDLAGVSAAEEDMTGFCPSCPPKLHAVCDCASNFDTKTSQRPRMAPPRSSASAERYADYPQNYTQSVTVQAILTQRPANDHG